MMDTHLGMQIGEVYMHVKTKRLYVILDRIFNASNSGDKYMVLYDALDPKERAKAQGRGSRFARNCEDFFDPMETEDHGIRYKHRRFELIRNATEAEMASFSKE